MNQEIDTLIEQRIDNRGPGVAVAVVKDGSVVHRKSYGLANLELSIPIAFDTVFRLGSITKQFTATAIIMLEEQGKLNVNEPITEFLPNYPTSGHHITVHHLLTHTSGIKSYTSIDGFLENHGMKDMTPEELCGIFSQVPFDFKPGSGYRYNNSGFYLLGMVIEKVSGVGYSQFIKENIFSPLGMNDSYYIDNEPVISGRASGYTKTDSGYENARYLSMTLPFAAGALGSTIDDLVIWDRSLRENTLIKESTLAKMYAPVTLEDGKTIEYGYGWSVPDYHGHQTASHGGGIPGFATCIARFPEDSLTVITLSNQEEFEAEKLTRHIARIMLGLPPITREPVGVSKCAIEKLTGTYVWDGFPMDVLEGDDGLIIRDSDEIKLKAANDSTFFIADDEEVEVRFEDEQACEFNRMILYNRLTTPRTAIRDIRASLRERPS